LKSPPVLDALHQAEHSQQPHGFTGRGENLAPAAEIANWQKISKEVKIDLTD